MRHLVANVVTYVIAGLLALGSVAWAWARSSQLLLSDEATVLAGYADSAAPDSARRTLGAASYDRNCASCHGDDGQGWDQYPPVAGVGALYARPGGRDYLIDLHLHGLASDRWRAPMPRMPHLADVELAAVVNHVLTHYGNAPLVGDAALVTPADVAARRGRALRPRDVDAARERLTGG